MFASLDLLREEVDGFDVDTLSGADAAAAVVDLAQLERLLASLRVRCAARAAAVPGAWQANGDRSAAAWLARQSGTTVRRAARELRLAGELVDSPEAAAAFARGELSGEQAALIADAVRVEPAAGGELVAAARSGSLAELRAAALAVLVRNDDGDRDRRAQQRRAMRTYVGADGVAHLSVRGPVDDIARSNAAVQMFRRFAFEQMKRTGELEGPEAVDYDAFIALIRHATTTAAPHHTAPTDAAPPDDESPDSAPADEESFDAEPHDAEPHDAEPHDAEPHDAEPTDAETQDADPQDDEPTGGAPRPAQPTDTTQGRLRLVGDPPDVPDLPDLPDGDYRSLLPRRAHTIVKRIDHSALVRGRVEPGEIAEINGFGAVSVTNIADSIAAGAHVAVITTDDHDRPLRVAHLRQPATPSTPTTTDGDGLVGPDWWMHTKVIVRFNHRVLRRPGVIDPDDPYLRAIIDHSVDVAALVHHGRKPTAAQRTALQWRDPTCRVAGCTAAARLEIDHDTPWAQTRHTTLDDLGHLCESHHNLKSRHGYTLEPGPGKRRLLPPERAAA